MRRAILALGAVVIGVTAFLVLRDTGHGLDLDAVSDCELPRVGPEPNHDVVDLDVALTTEEVTDLEGTIAADVWVDGRTLLGLRAGRVVVLDETTGAVTELVDLSDRITLNAEGGVLGVAVDPDGTHVYVHHTDHDGASHLLSYRIVDDGRAVDTDSERTLLSKEHAGLVHNGGHLVFGPDGLLHLGFGDGSLRVQASLDSDDPDVLDAKLLRIDPTPEADEPYAVPPGNPFVDGGGAPEVLASGLRNPWRFSFDPTTGDLWIADVGNDCYEEINVLPAGEAGVHFGWPRFEGVHELAEDVDDGTTVWPVFTYAHEGRYAVIGGHVYRGQAIPDLVGAYVYVDLCDGELRWLRREGSRTRGGALGVSVPTPIAFWADDDGELRILTAFDGMLRLVPADGNDDAAFDTATGAASD